MPGIRTASDWGLVSRHHSHTGHGWAVFLLHSQRTDTQHSKLDRVHPVDGGPLVTPSRS